MMSKQATALLQGVEDDDESIRSEASEILQRVRQSTRQKSLPTFTLHRSTRSTNSGAVVVLIRLLQLTQQGV